MSDSCPDLYILRRVSSMWNERHMNSWDIAKDLGISEPEALRLIARVKKPVPGWGE
jgi:hypothetical protein